MLETYNETKMVMLPTGDMFIGEVYIMKLQYRIKNDHIEILRCYGTDSRITIPEEIDGKPVTSMAAYAFSVHGNEEKEALVWETEEFFAGEEDRFLAGEEVEEIILPETVREIGRYIFYGCKKLRRLEISDDLMQVGTGAFTGCSGLEELVIHQKKGMKSCVKEILGELWQKIDVDFLYESGEAAGKRAHMVFPEHYDEAVENTPARILFTEYHGSGTNYRQCFYNKELDFAEYDSLFDMAVVMDKLEVLVDMSFGRIRYPWQLSEKAKKQYEDYIRGKLKDIGEYLVESGNLNGLELLSREKLWNREGVEHSIDVASRKKDMEISAFLMNERSRMMEEEQKSTSETESSGQSIKKRKKFQL